MVRPCLKTPTDSWSFHLPQTAAKPLCCAFCCFGPNSKPLSPLLHLLPSSSSQDRQCLCPAVFFSNPNELVIKQKKARLKLVIKSMLFSIYFLCMQVTRHIAAAEAIVKAHKADVINLVFIRHQIFKS